MTRLLNAPAPAAVSSRLLTALRILPATRTVRIELEIASPAAPSSPPSAVRVAIALVDASGREVWSSPGAPVTREDGQALTTIDVPAASLPAGVLEAVISTGATRVAPTRRPFLVLRD